jgi:protein-tyrosine phosphatase
MTGERVVQLLFVCMGNICRSPMAEGLIREHIRERGWEAWLVVDSAGTHDFHLGRAPDPRARAAILRRGIDIGALRARQVAAADFEAFDYVLAMDRANYEMLQASCPPPLRHKIRLLLDFAPGVGENEIPDPYYGGTHGFDRVLDLVEFAAEELLADVERRFRGPG